MLKTYKPDLIKVWCDVTLAAMEGSGPGIRKSSQAFFTDNIKHASQGKRTPPDWWYQCREEEEKIRTHRTKQFNKNWNWHEERLKAQRRLVKEEAADEAVKFFEKAFALYRAENRPEEEARRLAESHLSTKMGTLFLERYPQWRSFN